MRTKSVFYTIVRPGVVLSAGKNHRFGLDFEYASVREDSEMKAASLVMSRADLLPAFRFGNGYGNWHNAF